MQPKVSIVTVCYNAERYLEGCMQSIITQTYPNIEYILVDGNSNDGTLAIIKKMAALHSSITYTSEPDKGIYDAMNKGIRMCTGDVIACVNADDYLHNKNVVSSAVNLLNSTNADVVHSNIIQQIELDGLQFQKKVMFNFEDIANNMQLTQGTSFWRKNATKKIGEFDLSYRVVADYDYVLRGVKLGLKFVMSNDTWLVFRIGGISTTTCKSSNENRRLAKVHNTGRYWNYTKRYYTCIVRSYLKKIMRTQLQTPQHLISKGWQQV